MTAFAWPPAATVYLVRHGQAVGNSQGRYLGHTDWPLHPAGRHQAAALARKLARVPLAAVWSSDLSRARDTAAAIAAPHGLPVEATPALQELDFGRWDGLTAREASAEDPERFRQWLADPWQAAPPGGETLAQLAARVLPALAAAARAAAGRPLAVVCHGGPVRLLHSYYQAGDGSLFWQVQVAPGAVLCCQPRPPSPPAGGRQTRQGRNPAARASPTDRKSTR